MVDNDGSETPVTLPIEESKAQKQESVTHDSSKTSQSKVGSYLLVGGLIVVVVAVYCSIFPPPVDWVGMGESEQKSQVTTEEVNGVVTKTTTTQRTDPSKTLWDWMSLLLAPATLAGFGFWFQSSQEQAKADKEAAEKKAENASKERAEEQAQEEKERSEDRQREDALENYVNSISDLLIGKGFSTLVKQKEKSTLEEQQEDLLDAGLDIIRARTLSILRRLTGKKDSKRTDAGRKGSILLFLYDTGLIKSQALLSLSAADLSAADLRLANLRGVDLSAADLRLANLSNAELSGANLSNADLSGAELSSANLSNADLRLANLSGANLSNADLSGANLSNAELSGANLSNVDLSRANLRGAFLSDVDLSGANLRDAVLRDVDLGRANLRGAFLSDVDLSRADLRGAFLSAAYLSGANLSRADLRGAFLSAAYLRGANLSGADLSGAVLLRVDLRDAEELTQQQLEGENPPLLCNVTLPNEIGVVLNRDCEKIPQALLYDFPEVFENLAEAQVYVDEHSKP